MNGPAEHLWTRTDLRAGDVDVACVYDAFSFNCLSWLEALGSCKPGEGGTRIARDGEVALNPHGGQLSAGRLAVVPLLLVVSAAHRRPSETTARPAFAPRNPLRAPSPAA